MTALNGYARYKRSGLQWLPQIPADWSVQKLVRLTRMTVGWTPPTGDDASFIGENLWANISDLGERVVHDTAKRISSDAVQRARISVSPAGSLLYSFKLSVGRVSFAGRDLYTNEAIATFAGSENLDLRYAYYALPIYLIENASENIYGAKILNQERILATRIALPNRLQQQAIASFLDRETAEIDAFIADQEELIRLLTERRAATIGHAVTKGLDPTVPMRDSGTSLLGEIPAHWLMGPIRRFLRSRDSSRVPLSSEERSYRKGAYPYYGASGIIDYVDDFIFDEKLVLVSEDGANLVLRSKPVAFVADGKYWVNNHAHILEPDDGAVDYWAYRIESAEISPWVTGAAQPKLTIEALMGIVVSCPPDLAECRAIEAFLAEECSQLDAAIAEAREAIALSRERQAALISAAVTGKIDVREHAHK